VNSNLKRKLMLIEAFIFCTDIFRVYLGKIYLKQSQAALSVEIFINRRPPEQEAMFANIQTTG